MAAVKITSANTNSITGGARVVVRTSTGILYAAIVDTTDKSVEVWKSADGSSWAEQDASNNPAGYVTGAACAIDALDILHIVYAYADTDTPTNYQLRYVTFDTADGGAQDDAFNSVATIADVGTEVDSQVGIAIDSNNVPHVVGQGNPGGKTAYDTIYYANKVGGTWNALVQVEGYSASKNCNIPRIAIDKDNLPAVIYYNATDYDIGTAIGNVNNATSFTLQDVETDGDTTVVQGDSTICVDSGGNHWVAFKDETNDYLYIRKHNYGDGWSTWQSTVTDSDKCYSPSIVANGTDIYVFYHSYDTSTIDYNKYTGSWLGETQLEGATVDNPKAKWSYYNNNGGSTQIDYLFSDGTNIYWNKLALGGEPPPAPTIVGWKSLLGVGQAILAGIITVFDIIKKIL